MFGVLEWIVCHTYLTATTYAHARKMSRQLWAYANHARISPQDISLPSHPHPIDGAEIRDICTTVDREGHECVMIPHVAQGMCAHGRANVCRDRQTRLIYQIIRIMCCLKQSPSSTSSSPSSRDGRAPEWPAAYVWCARDDQTIRHILKTSRSTVCKLRFDLGLGALLIIRSCSACEGNAHRMYVLCDMLVSVHPDHQTGLRLHIAGSAGHSGRSGDVGECAIV